MRQIFSILFRALKNSAAEIGLSPKQFTEKIATLLKAIEFHREVATHQQCSLLPKYILTHTQADTHTMNTSTV